MNELTNAVGTLGFPIVAYLLLFFKLDKTLALIQVSLNNNTMAIQKLMADRGEKVDG